MAWDTEAIARSHYLQTTDAHFEKALAANVTFGIGPVTATPGGAGVERASRAAQNPAAEKQNRPVLPSDSTGYETARVETWPLSESNRYSLARNGF
jgi:hypothetical protein